MPSPFFLMELCLEETVIPLPVRMSKLLPGLRMVLFQSGHKEDNPVFCGEAPLSSGIKLDHQNPASVANQALPKHVESQTHGNQYALPGSASAPRQHPQTSPHAAAVHGQLSVSEIHEPDPDLATRLPLLLPLPPLLSLPFCCCCCSASANCWFPLLSSSVDPFR